GAGIAGVDLAQLGSEQRCSSLHCADLTAVTYVNVPKHADPRHAWRKLFEKLQPLCADAIFEVHETGGVAAWPRQVLDQAKRDWVANIDEYDWQPTCRLLQQQGSPVAGGQENVGS